MHNNLIRRKVEFVCNCEFGSRKDWLWKRGTLTVGGYALIMRSYLLRALQAPKHKLSNSSPISSYYIKSFEIGIEETCPQLA